MAKEIPYFKFYISEWLNADITLETFECQGVFINVCAYYWQKDADITLSTLLKRFRGYDDQINTLIESNIIKLIGDKISISFLNEQMESKEIQKITNRKNGSLGGRPKKEKTEEKPNGLFLHNRNETQTKANDNPNITNIKESKVKDITNSIVMSGKPDQSKSIDDRMRLFKETIRPFVEEYGVNTCKEFYDYWTEETKSGKKLKFELERTWDVGRRLKRWSNNDFNKNKGSSTKGYTPQLSN